MKTARDPSEGKPAADDGGERLRAFWRTAVRLAQGLTAGGALMLYLALDNGAAAALGLVLGGAASIVRFRMRYRTLVRSADVGALVRVRLTSYVVSGLALAPAFAWRNVLSPWSTVAGLFVMNASVIAADLLRRRSEMDRGPAPAREGT